MKIVCNPITNSTFVRNGITDKKSLANLINTLTMVNRKQTQPTLEHQSLRGKKMSHRAVAPVIATLLMVAIAVVGGTIIFVFSQGFFGEAQLSGTPLIESVEILGYDTRDVDALRAHDGTVMAAGTGGNVTAAGKQADERIAIYVTNHSVEQVVLDEVRFGGTAYTYNTAASVSLWNSTTSLSQGEYSILTDSTSILQEQTANIPPGQTATILVDLDDNYILGRDAQLKMTTSQDNVFVGTIILGQNRG